MHVTQRIATLTAAAAASMAVVGAVIVPKTAVAAPTPRGPVGSGWREYVPDHTLQIQSRGKLTYYPRSVTHATGPGGSYDRGGGIETFKLVNNGTNRVENRIEEEY